MGIIYYFFCIIYPKGCKVLAWAGALRKTRSIQQIRDTKQKERKIPSKASASPQTLCQWAFRLKDYTWKCFSPKKNPSAAPSGGMHTPHRLVPPCFKSPISRHLSPYRTPKWANWHNRKHILFHQDKFVFSVHHLGEHAIPLWWRSIVTCIKRLLH